MENILMGILKTLILIIEFAVFFLGVYLFIKGTIKIHHIGSRALFQIFFGRRSLDFITYTEEEKRLLKSYYIIVLKGILLILFSGFLFTFL